MALTGCEPPFALARKWTCGPTVDPLDGALILTLWAEAEPIANTTIAAKLRRCLSAGSRVGPERGLRKFGQNRTSDKTDLQAVLGNHSGQKTGGHLR